MKVLFEIPIYPTTKKEYDQKWDNRINQKLKEIEYERAILDIDITEEAINKRKKRTISMIEKENLGWRYNQRIGFIIIYYDETIKNIIFDIALSEGKHRFDSTRKKAIKNWHLLGQHFKVENEMTNEEIIEQTKQYICELMDMPELKNKYVDTNVFYTIIDSVDLKRICK